MKIGGYFLKNLYDATKKHKNVLVIATGSCALKLKMNPDLSRRSTITEMYPLKFSEFINLNFPSLISDSTPFIENFSNNFTHAVLNCNDAKCVYDFCKDVQNEVSSIYSKLPPDIEEDFLYIGGFPFVSGITQKKALALEYVYSVIEKLITKDIIEMKSFSSPTLSKIEDLIYLIASSDSTDYNKLCKTLSLDFKTLQSVMDVLVKSGLLVEVKSYGEKYVKVRKPKKYLFVSPSLRVSVLKGLIPSELKGKILEDYIALTFLQDFKKREFELGEISLTHDSSQNGADFILRIGDNKNVIIEVGYGKDHYGMRQIEHTAQKIKNFTYGIVISNKGDLELLDDRIVKIPLKYWLLI